MAWHRTGDKPVTEPTIDSFTDVYIRHSAMSYAVATGAQHMAVASGECSDLY